MKNLPISSLVRKSSKAVEFKDAVITKTLGSGWNKTRSRSKQAGHSWAKSLSCKFIQSN